MKISYTNILKDFSISVASDASSDTPNNVQDFDFSTNYSGNGVDTELTFSFNFISGARKINYVGIAGHTLVGTVEIIVDSNLVSSYTFTKVDEEGVLMFTFPTVANVTNVTVKCKKDLSPANTVMTVTHIAGGLTFDVPNSGETAGYKRLWLTPSLKQQVTLNQAAGPVSIINRSIAPKATLSIPNMPKFVAEGLYLELQKYIIKNAFFVIEQESIIKSAYLGFDVKLSPPTAHAATRELVDANFSFSAYNGVR